MGRITKRTAKLQLKLKTLTDEYVRFFELNGLHDWQSEMPGSFVLYPVRKLAAGKVLYFNYDLAKEMGLISPQHPHEMNSRLENMILETFSLRILNEYDQKQNIRYLPHLMKQRPYMATRYLQLQHSDKSGRTSGDGRSIWNGQIESRGQIWDVSSRGTGVTCLAPGVVEAQRPLKSGSTQFGYGCGLADIDELIGAAIMAEIFHRNGIGTERVLTVIDLGDGNGIGVRAAPNLMRPAHIFMHLKQGQYQALRRSIDYFINREYRNHQRPYHSRSRDCDRLMLKDLATTFGRFAAQLDRDYIFAWLDWDGDNVLANGGIIDYGSIRQFGLRHDEYRYDDVDRFSTNLSEQRAKARLIVQTFAQAIDYLKHKKKRPLADFHSHWSVLLFDREWDQQQLRLFLRQLGLDDNHCTVIMQNRPELVASAFSLFSKLESTKTARKKTRVPDGINRPPIFNMRSILVDLADFAFSQADVGHAVTSLPTELFFDLALADSAKGRDRQPTASARKLIEQFQVMYCEIVNHLGHGRSLKALTRTLASNCRERNRSDRMTGDALLYCVDEILTRLRRNKIKPHDVQSAIDRLIADQSQATDKPEMAQPQKKTAGADLFRALLSLVDGHKESI